MSGRKSYGGSSQRRRCNPGSAASVPSTEEVPIAITGEAVSVINSNPIVAASLHSDVAVTPSEAMGSTLQVTRASSAAATTSDNAPSVRTGIPPPSSQVNSNVANTINANKKTTICMPISNANLDVNTIYKPVKSISREPVKRNPSRRARVSRYSHCELCAEHDNSRMVQCDGCDKWFHFLCVEVSESVADVSWICPLCTNTTNGEQQQVPPESVRNEVRTDGPPPGRSGSMISLGTKSNRRSERRKAELKLQRLEEQRKLEQKYLDEKYKILEELDDCSGSSDSEFEKMSKVADWVRNTDRSGAVDDSGVVAEEPPEEPENPSPSVAPAAVSDRVIQHNPSIEQQQVPSQFVPVRRSTPQQSPLCSSSRRQVTQPPASATANPVEPRSIDDTICILNRSQLAARQAVSKDLPEFSGSPEDWPLFFSLYSSSTQMCGFSNEENMLRLRKCLKGKALDAVRCRLLHPSNVAGVLSTLKMLYGRPEAIVQAAVRKIRSSPPPDIDRLDSLVNFALTVENLVATVEACGVQDFIYNASLKYELVDRLPSTLKLDWARHTRGNPSPNLLDFSTWLYSMAEDASAVMPTSTSALKGKGNRKDAFLNVHSETSSSRSQLPEAVVKTYPRETTKQCFACKGSCSSLAKCKRFADLSYESKWAVIREANLCRKCLRKHGGRCKQQHRCDVNGCTYLHHPLLHNERSQVRRNPMQVTAVASTSCNVHQAQTSDILFRIAPVILHGPLGAIHTYAFLDDGSELTLMEHTLADQLGLKGSYKTLCLKWTGDTRRVENESKSVDVDITPELNPSLKYKLKDVRTIGDLNLRPQTLIASELQKRYRHLTGLQLASYTNVNPRILIGLDNARLGHALKSREGKLSEPIAIKTRLGWVVYGSCSPRSQDINQLNFHALQACECNQATDDSLHVAMKNYFALDSLGVTKPDKRLLSTDDQRALDMLANITHLKNGRYESGLLWKYDNVRLPDSKTMALKRWECLERRMHKDRELAAVLRTKMNEYIQNGYVRKAVYDELSTKHAREWYLPVFPVYNPNKPGKVRLVWDAAATVHGISLNSVLLKGPDQLTSLFAILIQFREFRYAVCGDIKEMYHQVLIKAEDQHCQRFFWKEKDTDSTAEVYVMNVMTFGASCSPAIAQYVKNSNAKRFEQQYPQAAEAIISRHYVDDMLVSVEKEDDAVNLALDVKRIHAAGGFVMRNWLSNSTAVLKAVDEVARTEKNLEVGDEGVTEKVLGLWWNTATDNFVFKVSPRYDQDLMSGRRRPTKREVLRTLMMIFDPVGFIAHFLMFLKVLLQEIWRSSVDWDTPIDTPQYEKWLLWLQVLPEVMAIKIPRCYRFTTALSEDCNVQLHTFVDASESGFAAVVYLRFQQGSNVETAFVSAKTKVAPLKFLSIPRSELQAGILGVRLADSVARFLTWKTSKRFFWTDSKDVLCWLNADHRRYSQFVAFRVSEILETTDAKEWRWVPTKLNVADEGTKWARRPDMCTSSRWFKGPAFLQQPEADWPAVQQHGTIETEMRAHLLIHTVAVDSVVEIHRFSRWNTLMRCVAYVYRFIGNVRAKQKSLRTDGPLVQSELKNAEDFLHRLSQKDEYAEEVATLLRDREEQGSRKTIPNSSSIAYLCPFIDDAGVLRVRGRTGACVLIDYDAVNPIILPRKHYVTRLIINHYHCRYHHQNHNTVVNEIRQRYRIPRLKTAYRNVVASCQMCKIVKAKPQPPAMSDLPPARLAIYARPFTHMGVDFFGPITISIGRRTEKRWILIATCMTTRAIHLQIAHTLSTDSCIMALRNVFARRGTPAVIYSDQGTNFKGASKEMALVLQSIDKQRFITEFTTPKTKWVFNPPASPHMGGAWERLIRTVKQNLAKLLPSKTPSYEVLENLLAEVENVVNSRPLTSIPVADDCSPVLTPNHFLVGSHNGLRPWVPFDDSAEGLRNCWRLSQVLANRFWKQWLRDYVPSITRRSKWFSKVKPIEVNDIVIIVDPSSPRNSWPKGRVIATSLGPDGQVRWATVQTSGGIYERPALKLAVVDVGVNKNTPEDKQGCIPGGSVVPA